MITIVLFHHVLGLTQGVTELAQTMKDAGYNVVVPDLFAGKTFSTLQDGLNYVGELGDQELIERANTACANLPKDVVYAGLSLGVVPAQYLLQTKPGALAGLLIHSFVDPAQLEGKLPEDVPIEVFAMDGDSFFVDDGDQTAARLWATKRPELRIHLYPGSGHLFAEPGNQDYDAEAKALLFRDIMLALSQLQQR